MANEKSYREMVTCDDHGAREATYVCCHILQANRSGVPCGFNWHVDEDGNFQAFCDACIALDEDSWQAVASDMIRVLCIDCYRRAATLHGLTVSRPA